VARLQWPKSFDWADDAVGLEDGRSSGPASAITRSTTSGGVLPLGAPDIWEAVQPAPTPAAHVSSRRRGKKRKSASAVRTQRSPAPVLVTQPGRAGRPLPRGCGSACLWSINICLAWSGGALHRLLCSGVGLDGQQRRCGGALHSSGGLAWARHASGGSHHCLRLTH
jgi:hypothetical protein